MELREYQKESIEEIIKLNRGETGLIALPTGSGKTIIMAELAKQIEGRLLIVVPSTELREQTIDKLKIFVDDGVTIGSVQANLNEVNAKIVVATRQSLTHKKSTRLDQMKEYGEFEYILLDECHQAVDQLKKVIDGLDVQKTKVVGFTATPFNPAMRKIFNNITYQKDLLWMIESEYLVEPKCYQISTSTDISKVKTTAGEFNQKDLENTINTDERNDLIVEAYQKYASDRKHTICFCSGIEHSRDLAQAFNEVGISCGVVDSTLSKDEREEVLTQFKNGEIRVICNIGVLTTGFNFRPADNIIFARPTKSKILYVQMLGRGLRLSPETSKENCLVLDFKDVITKHNLMDMESIFDVEFQDGETLKEAKERMQQEDLFKIESEKLAKEEEERRQAEIIAKEIELFNNNLEQTFEEAYYDWFAVNQYCYAISQECDYHYAVVKFGDEFQCYAVSTKKNESDCTYLDSFDCIVDAISFIEDKVVNASGGYAYRRTAWKQEAATEKQLVYVKYNKEFVETKWDAHLYFKKWLIKKLIKEEFIKICL